MGHNPGMNERTERLRQLMHAHGLKATRVADLLGRKEQTVRIWRCEGDNRVIPRDALELLELKLSNINSAAGQSKKRAAA
jgi:hypothetical protein